LGGNGDFEEGIRVRRPAVFIDRDGTINEQMGYINHISRFVLLQGTAEAVKILNRHDFLAIVVSNQSGVARGYFPIDLVEKIHSYMRELLQKKGAVIDGIYFCPHYEKGVVPEYSIACACRKPGAGLIDMAREDFDIDMANSYVVGDRCSDIDMALRYNLKGVLVATGYGLGEIDYVLPNSPNRPDYIAKDLLRAVEWIIQDSS
jgi:D-glycero-D-manno-heptose 1,7-bisphosphate phosphatase